MGQSDLGCTSEMHTWCLICLFYIVGAGLKEDSHTRLGRQPAHGGLSYCEQFVSLSWTLGLPELRARSSK